MTGDQNFKLTNNGTSIDFKKLKAGLKAEDFKQDSKMLELFGACDTNNNGELDLNEVSMFAEKIANSAGNAQVFDDNAAEKFFKSEKGFEKAQKSGVKASDLFNFLQKLTDTGNDVSQNNSEQIALRKEEKIVDGKRVVEEIIAEGSNAGKPYRTTEGTGEDVIISTYEYGDDGSVKITQKQGGLEYAISFDKDNNVVSQTAKQYENGEIVWSRTQDSNSTVDSYYNNGKLTSTNETLPDGTQNGTTYAENGNKTAAYRRTPDGRFYSVKYDGQGNTLAVVKDGETPAEFANSFETTVDKVVASNKDIIKYSKELGYYFLVAEEAKVEGEYDPEHSGLKGRRSSSEELQKYKQREMQRIQEYLEGRETKVVSADKDYKTLTDFVKDILKSEGIENPTNKQIVDRTNIAIVLNGGNTTPPKKGDSIVLDKTEKDISEAKDTVDINRSLSRAKSYEEAKKISMKLWEAMDKLSTNSVSSNDFQNAFKKIGFTNVVEVLNSYKNISGKSTNDNERISLTEAINREFTSSSQAKSDAKNKIISDLSKRAGASGFSVETTNDFEREAREYLKNGDDKNLDIIINGFAKKIMNSESISTKRREEIQSRSFEENKKSYVESYNEEISSAERAMQEYNDAEGWAASLYDSMKKFTPWTFKNTNKYVESDLKVQQYNLMALNNCKSEAEFKQKYKEIYGVDYDPVQVEAFEKNRERFVQATSIHVVQEDFSKNMSYLLKNSDLKEDVITVYNQDKGEDEVVSVVSPNEVYNRELEKLANYIGQGNSKAGKDFINKNILNGLPADASIDEKYKKLQEFVTSKNEDLKKGFEILSEGHTYEELSEEYNDSYTAAFGVKNRTARRVQEYIDSQATGSMVIKAFAKAVTTASGLLVIAASGGTSTPLIVGITSATSGAVIDASDRASSKQGVTRQDVRDITDDFVTNFAIGVTSTSFANTSFVSSLSDPARIATEFSADVLFETAVDVVRDNSGDEMVRNLVENSTESITTHMVDGGVFNGVQQVLTSLGQRTMNQIRRIRIPNP